MKASIAAGRLVSIDEGPTLADAVAGGMEPGSVTFPICRDLLDGILTVGEERLREAVRLLFREHGQVVEGAGALPAAGLIKHASRFRGRTVVLVASGGNISPGLFARTVGTDPRSS
jgi:threonine dehydratase